MKILSLGYTNSPEYNDPETWLKRIDFYTGILEALTKHNTVESIEQINYTGKLIRKGVSYHFINVKNYRELHYHVKRAAPEVILVNGFIFPWRIVRLKWLMGAKTAIIVLHRAEKPYKGIKRYLQKLADRYVNAYLFSSLDFKSEWRRNIDVEKMHEVVQASSVFSVMNKQLAKAATKVNGYPVFLWVGRLDANKDPLAVVSAFLKFSVEQRGAKLYMIYQSENLLEKLRQLISAHENGQDCIRLVGRTDHYNLQEWYNSADFIISGSHYEGGGTSVIEAMSCGCIPVLTDIESFRAITGRGACGLLYKAGDAGDLLQALLKTKEMDINGERQKVLQQFKNELSFEAIAGKIELVIASMQR